MRKVIALSLMSLLVRPALAESKSRDVKFNVPLVFELSGGTSELDQYIKNENVSHPLAGFVAGRYQFDAFQLGVCYLAISHSDKVNDAPVGSAPNPNEKDASENFTLTSLCSGFLIGNFLLINGGYGYATFSRSDT